MTEEEIIKYIKDEIEEETDTYHWFDDTPKNKTRLQIEESINAHQGLLDLYTNAKEEINKLNNVIDRMAEVLSDFDFDKQCEDCRCDYCNAVENADEYMKCIKEYFMKENKDE